MALRDAGKPAAARKAGAQAAALFEEHEGPRSPDLANALVELAGATHECGDYADALATARRALAILGRRRGDLDLERVRVAAAGQVAHSLIALGRYALAEKAARRALAIAKAKLPRIEQPATLNGLAVVYKYLARYPEAVRLYRAALAILERAYGRNAAELTPILHNLGGLAHAEGRFAEGVPFARRGLAIRQRTSGRNHPDTAADAAALAALLHGAGELAEAERLFRAAIRVYERTYGKEHFEVGFNLGNLAALCQAQEALARGARPLCAVPAYQAKGARARAPGRRAHAAKPRGAAPRDGQSSRGHDGREKGARDVRAHPRRASSADKRVRGRRFDYRRFGPASPGELTIRRTVQGARTKPRSHEEATEEAHQDQVGDSRRIGFALC